MTPCQWQLGELGDPTKSWMTPHAIWRWVAPWPTQGMAGLMLGTQGAAQGIAARQGQCWVPHEQRKAWLGSRWVPMAWGLTQGKVGCPKCSARHCQGKAECPRCSARGGLPFPPHCSTLTTRIGEKYLFFTSVKHWLKGSGEKYLFFPMRNTGQVKRTGGKVPFFADIQVTARPLQCQMNFVVSGNSENFLPLRKHPQE